MKKTLLFSLILTSFVFLFVRCSSDDTENPINPDPGDPGDTTELINIEGIWEMDQDGESLGGDLSDWCIPVPKNPSNDLPTEFALYPAHPNPTYQQTLIHYDLPAASDVHVYIIDSTVTTIRDLVDEPQQAGRYVISWDQYDHNEKKVEPGLYRLMMTAGDFECYGDIQIIPIPNSGADPVYLYADQNEGTMVVTYDAQTKIGGMYVIFTTIGTIGDVYYGAATTQMSILSTEKDNTFRILFSPGYELNTMPAGKYRLCTISIDGTMRLGYADASDTGSILETVIVNSP